MYKAQRRSLADATGTSLRVEYADISLLGGREENQDRVCVCVGENSALLLVADGMGGHAEGARAAEVTRQVVTDAFSQLPQPLFDPLGFLHLTLGRAHEEVVRIGAHLPIDKRPRATCAVCVVQGGGAWWAHVGDSRVYHLRGGSIAARTRDHSHVELLLREGLITAEQAQTHPMRNFVESCLGGDAIMPDMTLGRRCPLDTNDVLFACTDGLWAEVSDEAIVRALCAPAVALSEALGALGRQAVSKAGSVSDNTSAVALRWLGA